MTRHERQRPTEVRFSASWPSHLFQRPEGDRRRAKPVAPVIKQAAHGLMTPFEGSRQSCEGPFRAREQPQLR